MTTQQRITELEELAALEGIALPMPAAQIVALEEEGHVVDLLTGDLLAGDLLAGGADVLYYPSLALYMPAQPQVVVVS